MDKEKQLNEENISIILQFWGHVCSINHLWQTHSDIFLLFHPEGKSKKEKGAPIQRSTETGMAVELTRNMSRQPSRESNNGSMNSYNSEGKSVNPSFPALIIISTLLACLLSH